MQLFARDEKGASVFVKNASKQKQYECIECGQLVRVRGGLHKQKHFYHSAHNKACKLSGKSMMHLQTQLVIQQRLKEQEVKLEVFFKEINRIADVVWEDRKIIFEVQCSSISGQEISNRNRDYRKLGYTVIWILHETRYLSKAETEVHIELKNTPHYYTNIDKNGNGTIYDILFSLDKLEMQTTAIEIEKIMPILSEVFYYKKIFENRVNHWKIFFSQDFFDLLKEQQDEKTKDLHAFALCIEKKLRLNTNIFYMAASRIFYKGVVRPYNLLFQILLEKACR